MEWTIYRLSNDGEVKRYFASYNDAQEFAERMSGDSRWSGAIMRSPRGDELYID